MINVVNKRSYSKFKRRCKFYDRLTPQPKDNDTLPSLSFLRKNNIKFINDFIIKDGKNGTCATNTIVSDLNEFDFSNIKYLYSIDKFIHIENGYIYKIRYF